MIVFKINVLKNNSQDFVIAVKYSTHLRVRNQDYIKLPDALNFEHAILSHLSSFTIIK